MNDTRLSILRSGDDTTTSIRVEGEVDAFTAPLLDEELVSAVAAGSPSVVVDLSGVIFMDSTGLRVVLDADRQLRDAGRSLTLHSPSHAVQRLLELTSLDSWLSVDSGPV